MLIKRLVFTFALILSFQSTILQGIVENSIIPIMENLEILENVARNSSDFEFEDLSTFQNQDSSTFNIKNFSLDCSPFKSEPLQFIKEQSLPESVGTLHEFQVNTLIA